MRGMTRFCVTMDGQVLDAAKVVGSTHYSSGNEQIILVPEFVYEKWGQEFSEAVVSLLNRKRKFSYSATSGLVKAIGVGKLTCIAGAGLLCREDVQQTISDVCYEFEPCVQQDHGYSVPSRWI